MNALELLLARHARGGDGDEGVRGTLREGQLGVEPAQIDQHLIEPLASQAHRLAKDAHGGQGVRLGRQREHDHPRARRLRRCVAPTCVGGHDADRPPSDGGQGVGDGPGGRLDGRRRMPGHEADDLRPGSQQPARQGIGRSIVVHGWKVGPALAIVLSLVAPRAHADADLRAAALLGTGISDDPRSAVGGDGSSRGQAFLAARAGLSLSLALPSALHRGQYVVGITEYPGRPDGRGISQQGLWTSNFEFQRLSLGLEASGFHGLMTDPAPIIESIDEDVGPQPEALFSFAQGSVAQSLGYALAPGATLWQSSGASLFTPFRGDTLDYYNFMLQADVGAEYEWVRDAARIELSGGLERQTESRFEPEMYPEGGGEFGRLGLGWRHQLTPAWATDLSPGIYLARDAATPDAVTGLAPRAQLRWRGQRFGAGVGVDRGAQPSVVLGGIFVRDRLSGRLRGRFGNNDMFQLRARAAYQRLSMLQPMAGDGTATMATGRAFLIIRPIAWRAIDVTLSYRLSRQWGATLGRRLIKDKQRHAVMLSITVGLPNAGVEEEEETELE